MKPVLVWLRHRSKRAGLGFLFGAVLTWLAQTIASGPAVVQTDVSEASGAQFRDNGSLDFASHVHRNRVCQSWSQWWAWRTITVDGKLVQQVVPVASAVVPFFADTNDVVVTVPTPDAVKAAPNAEWFGRQNRMEYCWILPGWMMALLGERIYHSPDVPLRAVGDGEADMLKLPLVIGPAAAAQP